MTSADIPLERALHLQGEQDMQVEAHSRFAKKHAPHLDKTDKSRRCDSSAIAMVGGTTSSKKNGKYGFSQRPFLLVQVEI
jgi:hypothetical protein